MGNGNASATVIIAAAFWIVFGSPALAAAAVCREDLADLRWADGQARFRVEVVDDAAERAQGLMHRDHLAQSAGMLFVYPRPQMAAFWMRNTLIPLDMVFFDATGQVVKVHAGAVPGDETPISSDQPVRYVLEINAGLAERIGIAPGAVLRHPAVDAALAAWRCD